MKFMWFVFGCIFGLIFIIAFKIMFVVIREHRKYLEYISTNIEDTFISKLEQGIILWKRSLGLSSECSVSEIVRYLGIDIEHTSDKLPKKYYDIQYNDTHISIKINAGIPVGETSYFIALAMSDLYANDILRLAYSDSNFVTNISALNNLDTHKYLARALVIPINTFQRYVPTKGLGIDGKVIVAYDALQKISHELCTFDLLVLERIKDSIKLARVA